MKVPVSWAANLNPRALLFDLVQKLTLAMCSSCYINKTRSCMAVILCSSPKLKQPVLAKWDG